MSCPCTGLPKDDSTQLHGVGAEPEDDLYLLAKSYFDMKVCLPLTRLSDACIAGSPGVPFAATAGRCQDLSDTFLLDASLLEPLHPHRLICDILLYSPAQQSYSLVAVPKLGPARANEIPISQDHLVVVCVRALCAPAFLQPVRGYRPLP